MTNLRLGKLIHIQSNGESVGTPRNLVIIEVSPP